MSREEAQDADILRPCAWEGEMIYPTLTFRSPRTYLLNPLPSSQHSKTTSVTHPSLTSLTSLDFEIFQIPPRGYTARSAGAPSLAGFEGKEGGGDWMTRGRWAEDRGIGMGLGGGSVGLDGECRAVEGG